jgi:hypothetical protein
MPLPKSILCTSCKKTYPEGWKRCPYCGYDEQQKRDDARTAKDMSRRVQAWAAQKSAQGEPVSDESARGRRPDKPGRTRERGGRPGSGQRRQGEQQQRPQQQRPQRGDGGLRPEARAGQGGGPAAPENQPRPPEGTRPEGRKRHRRRGRARGDRPTSTGAQRESRSQSTGPQTSPPPRQPDAPPREEGGGASKRRRSRRRRRGGSPGGGGAPTPPSS